MNNLVYGISQYCYPLNEIAVIVSGGFESDLLVRGGAGTNRNDRHLFGVMNGQVVRIFVLQPGQTIQAGGHADISGHRVD